MDITLSAEIGGVRGPDSSLFQAIHQIDLVPTISLLLGLPIPFSNLGGIVPSLIPPINISTYEHNMLTSEIPYAAMSFALNAAQVWQYLITYSSISHSLPPRELSELKSIVNEATTHFLEGVSKGPSEWDELAYRKACRSYKYFLTEATKLGQQVWTRFDMNGMIVGIMLISLSLVLQIYMMVKESTNQVLPSKLDSYSISIEILKMNGPNSLMYYLSVNNATPLFLVFMTMTFQVFALPFGNSYILAEKEYVGFALGLLGLVASYTLRSKDMNHNGYSRDTPSQRSLVFHSWFPILLSRMHGLLITGHGKDPKIRLHLAHNPAVFLTSLLITTIIRFSWFLKIRDRGHHYDRLWKTVIDTIALGSIGCSWVEKRSMDMSRSGYFYARLAFLIYFMRLLLMIVHDALKPSRWGASFLHHFLGILSLLVMSVTGPSAASSMVVFFYQYRSLNHLASCSELSSSIFYNSLLASLWKLSIRNAFFVTGHACSFSQLQVSAAFVLTGNFHYVAAGTSLFLNTFGWEIIGSILCFISCKTAEAHKVWSWFCLFHFCETLGSCISIFLLRRHLMVWAIFAPRFLFQTVFCVIFAFVYISSLFSRIYHCSNNSFR